MAQAQWRMWMQKRNKLHGRQRNSRIWTGVVLCVLLLNLSGCVGKSGANVTPTQNEVQAGVESQVETKVQSESMEQEFRASENKTETKLQDETATLTYNSMPTEFENQSETKSESQTATATGSQYTLKESPLLYSENPQEENLAGMLQEAAAGMMVQLVAGNVSGSGVLWKVQGDELWIATAAHVVTQGTNAVEITFSDGFHMTAERVAADADTDIALLAVSLQDITAEHLESYCVANVDEETAASLQEGDGIIVMASGKGVAADAYEGKVVNPWIYVEDFGQDMLLLKADAEPGMSGGGIFDSRGHFLGILCGRDESGQLAAVPISVLKTFSENF